MNPTLSRLRQTPQPTPAQFLAAQPGCWIQYYDDTPAKDTTKALSARSFDLGTARRKQRERCAVGFSLQAFGASRTKEELLCFRNLGVDVDLLTAIERRTLGAGVIDRWKEEYLERRLLPFPLKPHWLIETRHGFHAVFRVRPQRGDEGVRQALDVNRRLVAALRGDPNAVLLTQVLRVPRTLQFKHPAQPFLCRLLLDNAATSRPYDLETVRGVLDVWEVAHGIKEPRVAPAVSGGIAPRAWREGLAGVAEGQRNATAVSLAGKILGCLPADLWETAGLGGLREWNRRNTAPLPDAELRRVFSSIARREWLRRSSERPTPPSPARPC